MSDLSQEDLQSILREQNEIRLRLVALDRKIDQLAFQKPVPKLMPVIPVVAVVAAEKKMESPTPSPIPPALPVPIPSWDAPAPALVSPIQSHDESDRVPQAAEKLPESSSWEFKLGTVWLVRIGIVILLTGLVFLGNYAYHYIVPRLGPWLKLALLSFLGGGLAWLGSRLEKSSESLRNYGRVLLAGGAALLYYTTYGASFVDKLRVIYSPLLGGVLLLAVGGAVVWLAEKRQAQSVALTAILLSYYTSAINPLGLFTLYSSLLLTLAAVYFLLKHRWTTVSFLSLLGTYGSYAFWHFNHAGSSWQAGAFLACYWVLFTTAVFLSRSTSFIPEKRTPFLTINNAAFFGLVFQILHANHPEQTGRFSLVFGGLLLALSWFAKRRQTDDLFLDGAYLIQGLGVLTFGLLTELNGYQLSLALALQGTLMLFSINRRHGWIYEIGAGVVIVMALGVDASQGPVHITVWWALAGLFIADAWLTKNYKKHAEPSAFNWLAAAYSLFAVSRIARILLADFTIWSSQIYLPLGTVALLALGAVIRLRELGVTGQLLALFAALSYIVFGEHNPGSTLALILTISIPLLLMHWWQWQKERDFGQLGQTLFSFVFLAAAIRWTTGQWWDIHLEFYLNLLAVVVLLYGSYTRAFILALIGQILVVCMAGLFFYEAFFHNYHRLWPTLNLGVIALDLALVHFLTRLFPEKIQHLLKAWQQILSLLIFAMLATWGWAYLPETYRMLYYVGVASLLFQFALQLQKRNPARAVLWLIYAGVFAVIGLLLFWRDLAQGKPASWLHVLALFFYAGHERFAKSRFPATIFPAFIRHILIVAAVSGFWLEWNRWIDFNESAFPKTLAWATLGTIALCLGLVIRERTYRVCGLALLALATIRVFVNDIWGLDPIFRILSFIVLGVVLLGLGFIYNKFADKLKEWL